MVKALTHQLLNHAGVNHGFFTREGGVSTGLYDSLNAGYGSNDTPENVTENRRRIADHLNVLPNHLLSLHQYHSTEVLIIDRPFKGRPKADGLVTKTPGIAISALAADCGPVLFCDPSTGVIGACHAGWRGALAGITDQTIRAMESIGADRDKIHAVLGPCISQANYEVGHDYRDSFVAENETYDRFFKLASPNKNGERKPHFDLKRFVLFRLKEAGLQYVDALPDCTYGQSKLFFSYRYNTHQGESDYGRNISAICLTK